VCAATILLSVNRFSGPCLAAFLTIISAAATAEAQISAGQLNPAEEWVVAKVKAGEKADLLAALNADRTRKFPEEKDRRLRADFLKELLTGRRPEAQPQQIGVRIGVRIVGATVDDAIDISNEQVPWDIWLERCHFMSSAIFHHASFAWNISFENSEFRDAADFDHIRVANIASFHDAVFAGPVDFSSADIGNVFDANRVKFQKRGASFNGMKVRGDIFFNDATFEVPVLFRYANIANNFEAQRTQFQKYGAVLSGIKIGNDAIFEKAKFEGPMNFSYANIANNFDAKEATFENEKNGAVFSGMKVGGEATFCGAVFKGPVYFNYAEIARLSLSGPFPLTDQFHIQGMSYKHIGVVQPELCSLGSLSPASLRPLLLYSLNPKPLTPTFLPPSYSLSQQTIPLLPVRMYLESATAAFPPPTYSLNLKFFQIPLRWHSVFLQLPMFDPTVQQPEPESESPGGLLELAHQSAYSVDAYSRLEQFFLGQGDRADADEAFIAGKSREREEYFRTGQWGSWLRSWMLCLLVGYGRRPWQVGIPCVVLVALGCVLFSPKKMEPRNPAEAPRVYSRFWYSLGLFLPFVDLQADRVWKPKTDQTFLRNYMRVHILLGWILVPLVLAAVTGLIK
jgi:uncharacterized protein YjbI with pentapeptide repeats